MIDDPKPSPEYSPDNGNNKGGIYFRVSLARGGRVDNCRCNDYSCYCTALVLPSEVGCRAVPCVCTREYTLGVCDYCSMGAHKAFDGSSYQGVPSCSYGPPER